MGRDNLRDALKRAGMGEGFGTFVDDLFGKTFPAPGDKTPAGAFAKLSRQAGDMVKKFDKTKGAKT